jgi:diguanylate cyclase
MNYIKRFFVDALKIDRSFVRDITSNPQDLAIVKAVLAMAQSLGINVIAEGVETENQLQVLRALGCNQYQGYLFCPPLPAAELERRFFTAPDAQPAR